MSEDETERRVTYYKTRVCWHISSGELPQHSTLTWRTVAENPTDYAWDMTIELCTFCSGRACAQFDGFLGGIPEKKAKP